jgi:hypothetical protein
MVGEAEFFVGFQERTMVLQAAFVWLVLYFYQLVDV